MCGGSGTRPEASLLADGIVCCIRVDGRRGSAGQQCGWESAAQWPGAERLAIDLHHQWRHKPCRLSAADDLGLK